MICIYLRSRERVHVPPGEKKEKSSSTQFLFLFPRPLSKKSRGGVLSRCLRGHLGRRSDCGWKVLGGGWGRSCPGPGAFHQKSGQIIATSHDLTLKGSYRREIPLFQGDRCSLCGRAGGVPARIKLSAPYFREI